MISQSTSEIWHAQSNAINIFVIQLCGWWLHYAVFIGMFYIWPMLECKQGFCSALIVLIRVTFQPGLRFDNCGNRRSVNPLKQTLRLDVEESRYMLTLVGLVGWKQRSIFLWVIITVTILIPSCAPGWTFYTRRCGRWYRRTEGDGDKILNLAPSAVQWLLWWVIGGGSYHNVLRGIIVGSK